MKLNKIPLKADINKDEAINVLIKSVTIKGFGTQNIVASAAKKIGIPTFLVPSIKLLTGTKVNQYDLADTERLTIAIEQLTETKELFYLEDDMIFDEFNRQKWTWDYNQQQLLMWKMSALAFTARLGTNNNMQVQQNNNRLYSSLTSTLPTYIDFELNNNPHIHQPMSISEVMNNIKSSWYNI